MPAIRDIIQIMQEFAPLELQCGYDNSGLLYGNTEKHINAVLVALDTNPAVIQEAIDKGCGLIIEHHPTLFTPLKKIDLQHPKHAALCLAIRHDIAIYSAHTNVDFAQGGLNDYLAEKLGCKQIRTADGSLQSMRIGELEKPVALGEYAGCVALILQDTNIATVGDTDKQVRTVAVANGAGGGSEEAIWQAKNAGADILVTSELKYNVVRLAKDINYGIISVGHYAGEALFTQLICSLLDRSNSQVKAYPAQSLTNPFNDRS